MPIIDVKCQRCKHEFETLVGMTADGNPDSVTCESCGGPVRRVIRPFHVATKEDVAADPNVERMLERNRRYYNTRKDEIRSGELDLKFRGQKRFWPDHDKRLH